MRLKDREAARKLRIEEGLSLNEICQRLSLSKSSVSIWVKDIKLTEKQKDRLTKKYQNSYKEGAKVGNTYQRDYYYKKRVEYQKEGKELLYKYKEDSKFIAGIMLFWAEGSKDRYSIIMTNSNIHMLSFFIQFLKKYFKMKKEDIKFSFQFYSNNGISVEEVKKYWIKGLKLPEECFKRYTVDKRYEKAPGMKKGKAPYGIGRIVINSVRKKQMIFGAIQAFIGFKDENWLW